MSGEELHLCLFVWGEQQKTLMPGRAGSAESGRPRCLAADSAPFLTAPVALTVPVAQLNGLQAEVFDHLLTGAGGAVEGMIQTRHLHFSNSLLKPACFVSRLSPWTGGREGRERVGSGGRRGTGGLGRGSEGPRLSLRAREPRLRRRPWQELRGV